MERFIRNVLLKHWSRTDWFGDLACMLISLRMPKHIPTALGVGLPRSGTHTIAECWSGNVAWHEAWHASIIHLLTQYKSGKISKRRVQRRLLCRWRLALRVDLDVFHALHHFLDVLPEHEQPSHYILTVREPIKWVESIMNQSYITRDMPIWMELEDYNHGRYNLPFESWDTDELQRYVRWPVRAYFKYWNDHVAHVLSTVDKNKLIVGQPNMLPGFLSDIADFCNLDKSLLVIDHHGGKGNRQIPSTAIPDRETLLRIFSEECEVAVRLLSDVGISIKTALSPPEVKVGAI
ncbi:MAG: hypothetical protein HRT81_07725 [Henriciella sp.]|nr:hypothetical protein [Henriciella sp.]